MWQRTRIGLLRIELRMPYARSLKDRRRVVRSLADRLRARCLVAVAETGDPEALRDGEVSVVAVGLGWRPVEARLRAAAEIAVRAYPSEVVASSLDDIEWGAPPPREARREPEPALPDPLHQGGRGDAR